MLSRVFQGSSVGTAVTYIACGYLMDWIGWESVFYTTGLIGLLWYGCWTYLIYDSPSVHPTISEEERKYIEDSLGNSVLKNYPVSNLLSFKCIYCFVNFC